MQSRTARDTVGAMDDWSKPWRRFVIAVAGLSALVSIAFVAILLARADASFLAINEPLFVGTHPSHALSDDTRMAQCIGFGLFGGWSVTIAWAYAIVPTNALRPMSKALLGGTVVWYGLDSIGSIASHAPWNAALNTVYFVAMVVPLVAIIRISARPRT